MTEAKTTKTSFQGQRRLWWIFPASSLGARLWIEHVRVYASRLSFALVFLAFAAVCAAGQAQLLQPAFDRVMLKGDTVLLWVIPLAYVAMSAGRGFSLWMQSRITSRIGGLIVFDIQKRIFDRLLCMDLDQVYRHGSGTLVARFTYDLQLLREMFTRSCVAIPKEIVLLIAYFGLMFYHNAKLTIIALVAYPLIAFPLISLSRRLRGMSLGHQHYAGKITHFLSDTLRTLPSILIYGAENIIKERGYQAFDESRKLMTRTQWTRAALTPINEILGGLTVAFLIGFGGYEVMTGAMTIGQFTTFLTAMMLSYQPIRSLSGHNAHLQEGLAVVERMYDLLDQKDRTHDKINAKPFKWRGGMVRFVNATRQQPGKDIYQFKNISFSLPPGRRIAFFGDSGSGKSSIISAMLRFIPLDGGYISIDGQRLADLQVASVRRHFAYVSQDTLLMHGSAIDNITMGQPLDEERLEHALRMASAESFLNLDDLPREVSSTTSGKNKSSSHDNGRPPTRSVHENVGEAGNRFSGGQQQRIALARAFYRNAKIIILDEPTSALDKGTEVRVLKNLFKNLVNRTVILITHNPDNLRFVDDVIVIKNQQIVDQGPPDKIIAQAKRRS